MKSFLSIILILILFSCKKVSKWTDATNAKRLFNFTITYPTVCNHNLFDVNFRKPIKTPTNVIDTTTTIPIDENVSVIFLDFDGQNVLSPLWNNGQEIYCKPSGLTATDILNVRNTTRNFYSKYKVVVTTDSTDYFLASSTHRQRVIITATSFLSNTGASYIGSMFYNNETPDFVFSANLYYNSFYVGQLCAHEAGHTIGLYHQSVWSSTCQFINEYNTGKIMGNSLNTAGGGVWWIGATPNGCNDIQNDNEILTNKLGLK